MPDSISTDKINSLMVSGVVSSIKEISNGRIFMVLKQPIVKSFLFFPCVAKGIPSMYAMDEIMPGDQVIVIGKMGNWKNSNSPFKTPIIIMQKCIILNRAEKTSKEIEWS